MLLKRPEDIVVDGERQDMPAPRGKFPAAGFADFNANSKNILSLPFQLRMGTGNPVREFRAGKSFCFPQCAKSVKSGPSRI